MSGSLKVAVEYRDPERLSEVLDVLRERGEDAKLVAGGRSLMVMLRQGLIAPAVLLAARAASPVPDVHASPDYRRWLAKTLVPRALASASAGPPAGRGS